MQRTIIGLAVLAVSLCCPFTSLPSFAEGPHVIRVIGKAEILRATQTMPARLSPHDELRPGDQIRVIGRGIVRLEGQAADTVVLITKDSTIKYLGKPAESGALNIFVPKGTVYFKIKKGHHLDLKTPQMVASVRGTKFAATVRAARTHLSVIVGQVLVEDNYGHQKLLGPSSGISATDRGFIQGSAVGSILSNTSLEDGGDDHLGGGDRGEGVGSDSDGDGHRGGEGGGND